VSRKSCLPFSIPTFSKFQCNPCRLEWFITVNLTVEKGEYCRKKINQPEDSLMSRRFIITMLGVSLALFLMPQVPLAAEDHIAEAITHTKQAIEHGKMGHADVLTTHAEAALTHAQAGEKAKANPHSEEAIKHLEQAIDEGKKGHADAATTHAEAALTHLEQVK
jgi:hypothetical protein